MTGRWLTREELFHWISVNIGEWIETKDYQYGYSTNWVQIKKSADELFPDQSESDDVGCKHEDRYPGQRTCPDCGDQSESER